MAGEATLIVGPSWLGDAIMMGALIQRLNARVPAPRVTVFTPAHLEGLVRRLPGVDDTILNPFAHGALRLGERWRVGRTLAGRFDEAIVLPHSLKSALVPAFAGIRRRAGFVGESRYGLLNDLRRLDEARLPRLVDQFCLLAEAPDVVTPAETPAPTLASDPAEVAATLQRFGLAAGGVALCVGAEYGPAKRWPAAHFGALARRIAESGRAVWLLGGSSDTASGAETAALAAGAAVDLTGKTKLTEAADLIAAASAVVSNDSGLMHVAAALGRPLVALYGSSSPAFTPPLSANAAILSENLDCSPCFERVCPLGHFNCLNGLSPDRVWAALAPRLA
ncbi:MAG TPA: lipopolysaccharide heptosyltransferase II [Caulobacteraceae bacterium]|jgi:heptosyltransferase-2